MSAQADFLNDNKKNVIISFFLILVGTSFLNLTDFSINTCTQNAVEPAQNVIEKKSWALGYPISVFAPICFQGDVLYPGGPLFYQPLIMWPIFLIELYLMFLAACGTVYLYKRAFRKS
jgi:hypothetical protein